MPASSEKMRAAPMVIRSISVGSESTPSSTRRSPTPSAVSSPVMPKAAWSNSTSLSWAAWGAWSVAMQSMVPSASAARSTSMSCCERSGGFTFMQVS